jgi:hypothetical protein
MANTATVVVNKSSGAREQLHGMFSHMYFATITITNNDAIALTDTATFAVTVTGAALGDMVLFGINNDLSDGTDQGSMTAVVTAADTVALRVLADKGEYAADDLNNSITKIAVLRPNW